MPNGHVKVFHPEHSYGFIVASDGVELHVKGDAVQGGALSAGDGVEFEIADSERGRPSAVNVKVVQKAPDDSPAGRTMAPPPSWEELEDRERQRRMARRRRR